MSKTISTPIKHRVQMSRDHLEQQSKGTPQAAMEEMIWNGLDAGGPSVKVHFESNSASGVTAIEVADKGAGILPENLERTFGRVGDSVKLTLKSTPEGRLLHGSQGRGRFRGVLLGAKAVWTTTFKRDGTFFRYSITVWRMTLDEFESSVPIKVDAKESGTVLRIEGVDTACHMLLGQSARDALTEQFALYLADYPNTVIDYSGHRIDMASAISNKVAYPVELNGLNASAQVVVIEWKFKPDGRRLLLCDSTGFAWGEVKAGIQARGFDFTAYLRTNKVKDWQKDNRLALAEVDEEISSVLDKTRDMLRAHFRERLAAQAQDVVADWKKDDIYPYSEDETSTPVKKAERELFDIIAVRVHQYHPSFRESERASKQLTLQLFKQALESNPGSIQKILKEVLHLPKDLQDELADLLERTSLQSLIEAASIVSRRLLAIRGFDEILFQDDWKKRLLERSQLHRLLVRELWLLGEEYTLDTDDDPLREVLIKHVKLLERDDIAPDIDVNLINGKDGIPDLMLSRRFLRRPNQFEHLILELKRPSVTLGSKEITQIETYGFTISKDPRFSKENTQWTFVLLGNDFDAFAEEKANADHNPAYGCIHKKGNVSIWIRRWSEVLHDARLRYEFFREKLNLEASSEAGMKYLHDNYSELLTGRGKRKGKESKPDASQGDALDLPFRVKTKIVVS